MIILDLSLQNPNLHKYLNSSNKIDAIEANSILLINHEGDVKIKSEAITLTFVDSRFKISYFNYEIFPNKIRNLVYSLVAKHRYKIFGKMIIVLWSNKSCIINYTKKDAYLEKI